MRNVVRLAPIVLVILAEAGTAVAQEQPVLRLTLEEAQMRAIRTSHQLAEGRAREAAARAVIGVQEAAQRPIIVAQAGYTRTNHVLVFRLPGTDDSPSRVLYPDVPDNYRTRLDLEWPIYNGRYDALERAARAEASAVAADVATTQADLRLEVARAFWAVVTARATVEVLEQGVTRSEANTAEVRQRFNAGLVPPNEVASAEAQESRSRMLLIEARNQRDVASADLARLADVDPGQMIEPASDLVGTVTSPQVEQLLADARQMRNERRALQLRITAADDERAAAAAGRLPTVSASGVFDYARPNPFIFPRTDRWEDSWTAGINLSWSLWDGGRTAADVAQAAALADAARQRLAEFDSVLSVEVRQRALEIDSGRAAVAAADDAVRAAAEARRVVAERYRAGVITQVEVLDAEFALLQAQLDRTRALANIRFAEARLARAVGR